jgi:SulP family sulfate permease
MNRPFMPKLFTVLKEGYSLNTFWGDLAAGVIVGVIAVPMSIAFGIASGVRPEQGLVTAVVAGFLISFLGGSRVQVGGPTGAFIVIIYGIVHQHGYNGLAIATVMAGGMLVLLGLLRMGTVIKFIPYPVTIGFTSGIALIIFSSQVKDFLGLQIEVVPADFLEKWASYFRAYESVNGYAVALALGSLVLIRLWPRVTAKIPGSLVAIVGATLLMQLLDLPVETIGSRFGTIEARLPMPQLPDLSWGVLRQLFPAAMSIAFLAAIESLLSAVVADGMTGGKHRSNVELVAQGAANLVSPLFMGIPATGAIARTAANIKNGGKTPVAGMIHAGVVLVLMMVLGRWVAWIPMAVLAAILVSVAINMSEVHFFVKLFKAPKQDVAVLLITFLLTVFVDLTVAIEVGMILAAFLFMYRMIQVSETKVASSGDLEETEEADHPTPTGGVSHVPEGVEVFEISGPFFFGATEKFKQAMSQMNVRPKVLILRMRQVPALDATGLQALEEVIFNSMEEGTQVLMSGVQPQPLQTMTRSGLLAKLGRDHIYPSTAKALAQARKMITSPS